MHFVPKDWESVFSKIYFGDNPSSDFVGTLDVDSLFNHHLVCHRVPEEKDIPAVTF